MSTQLFWRRSQSILNRIIYRAVSICCPNCNKRVSVQPPASKWIFLVLIGFIAIIIYAIFPSKDMKINMIVLGVSCLFILIFVAISICTKCVDSTKMVECPLCQFEIGHVGDEIRWWSVCYIVINWFCLICDLLRIMIWETGKT